MHQQKNSPHIPPAALHKGLSSKGFESIYQLNPGEHSPSSKNNEAWAYRPLQPETSSMAKSLSPSKVIVKCNVKTMDWQLVAHNMTASHPNPAAILKKKDTPSNAAKKEISISSIPRPTEIAERISPVNHDFDPLQRRPITVILSTKNKSDPRGKAPKSLYEPMGLNVAGYGVIKKNSSKEELEDAEAMRKLGHNITPSLRLGTSTGAKVRSEGGIETTSIMNLEEKGSSGDKLIQQQMQERLEKQEKQQQSEGGRRAGLATAEKGFRMRKWINESSPSVGSTPSHKFKAAQTMVYKSEDGFKGFPFTMKSETENNGSLTREEIVPMARSEKMRALKSEENESKHNNNIFQQAAAVSQPVKLRTYRLEKILNGESKHIQKRTTPKPELFESHGDIVVAQLPGEEEEDFLNVRLKKATSLGVKKKIEGPSPREVSRALKRTVYRPAIDELLGNEKESQQTIGKSWEVQRERVPEEGDRADISGQVKPDVENIISNNNERPVRRQKPSATWMNLKPAVAAEYQMQQDNSSNINREAFDSIKVTIPARHGLSLTRVPTVGKGDKGDGERSNERYTLGRKDSIGNLVEKQSKRNKAVVVEEPSFTAGREEPVNFLERKLINQGGKGLIEGWDLGLNESEPDSPIVFSPWGRKKVVNE